MAKILHFPIRQIVVTKGMMETAYQGSQPIVLFPETYATVLTLLKTYQSKRWGIESLLSEMLDNDLLQVIVRSNNLTSKRKIILNNVTIREYLIADGIHSAWNNHLSQTSVDPQLFRLYQDFHLKGVDRGVLKFKRYILDTFNNVDFLQSGLFELIKSMYNNHHLNNVSGVREWLTITLFHLQHQWLNPGSKKNPRRSKPKGEKAKQTQKT